jgi:hypothetical protein
MSTATAASAPKPPANWNDIQHFMASVVPWPGTDSPGFVNLHYSMKVSDKKLITGAGWPYKAIEPMLERAAWCNSRPNFKGVWFCTSSQRSADTNAKGKPKAIRLHKNVQAVKALWVDIDVKPDDTTGKHYITMKDAWDAITAFRKKVGLPQISAAVNSGGGLHVYWISDKALDPVEWLPYASGLKALLLKEQVKCDAGLTTDDVRLLRMPGTFNHKYDPPREVTLLPIPLCEHNFAETMAFLPTVTPSRASPIAPLVTFNAQAFAGKKPDAAFAGLDPVADRLGAGIDVRQDVLLDPRPIFAQCPFMRTAFATGGKDYAEPLWNLSVLCTTFMENGNDYAHEISRKHEGYSKTSTQAKFDQKMADRADRGVGYPQCATIAGDGCSACATCPHFAKGKSPLNLTTQQNKEATGPAEAGPSHGGAAFCGEWADPLDFDQVPVEEAVDRINAAGYFVLTLNGDIYKASSSGGVIVQKREGFTTLFACRQACSDDGLINAGTAWKSSSRRREYDSIGYWPNNHDRADKSYNLWRGWGVEPKKGVCSIVHDLILDVIANGNHDKANFILDWLAHMVQRPWEKPGVALVLRGRKGTGKSLLVGIVARAIGKSNTLTTASAKSLFGTYNWHLADKLLICAEEAFFAGNREHNDQLKHLLTGGDIEVEQKYGQRFSMKSMHRMIMTSNHNQVVAASDDERRFYVCDVSEKRKGDDGYFAPLVRALNGEDEMTLAAFMYELQNRDIKGWKAEQAARDASGDDLARQKLLGLEPPLQWLLEQTTADPIVAATQTGWDTGVANELDPVLDQGQPQGRRDAAAGEQSKSEILASYRNWAKTAQVRGASDYTVAENFWASIKRLLNDRIFPGRRLFRTSGGTRFVIWPPRRELMDGFNRLLGGRVAGNDDDDDGQS